MTRRRVPRVKAAEGSQFYAEAFTAYLQDLEDDAVTRDINDAIDAAGDDDDVAAWTEAAY